MTPRKGVKGQSVSLTQTDYVTLTFDLCMCISLTPSTKVTGLENLSGHLGSQGQKIFFTKK